MTDTLLTPTRRALLDKMTNDNRSDRAMFRALVDDGMSRHDAHLLIDQYVYGEPVTCQPANDLTERVESLEEGLKFTSEVLNSYVGKLDSRISVLEDRMGGGAGAVDMLERIEALEARLGESASEESLNGRIIGLRERIDDLETFRTDANAQIATLQSDLLRFKHEYNARVIAESVLSRTIEALEAGTPSRKAGDPSPADFMTMDVFTMAGHAMRNLIENADQQEAIRALVRIRDLTRMESASRPAASLESILGVILSKANVESVLRDLRSAEEDMGHNDAYGPSIRILETALGYDVVYQGDDSGSGNFTPARA